jgi:hypothetical protein
VKTIHHVCEIDAKPAWKTVFNQIAESVPSRYTRIATLYAPRSLGATPLGTQAATLYKELQMKYPEIYRQEYPGYEEPAELTIFAPRDRENARARRR